MAYYLETFPLFFIIGASLFCIIVILIRIWGLKKRNYWKNQNMPYIKAPVFVGHFSRSLLLKKPITDTCQEIYSHESVKDQPFVGVNVFHKPALFIRDPVLVRRILQQDGSFFSDGHSSVRFERSISYRHVKAKQEFEELKSRLENAFTDEKLLTVFKYISQIGNELNAHLDSMTNELSCVVDVRDLVETFTVDTIARVIYGIEAHTINQPDSSYRKHQAEVFKEGSWRLAWTSNLANISSKLSKRRSFVWLNHLQRALNERKENYARKDDLIDILVEASVADGCHLDLHTLEKLSELVSIELRLVAPLMLFTLFELSRAENAQNKLRGEILRANRDQLQYEYVSSNDNYLGRVIRETLRLHPIEAVLKRECHFPDDEENEEGYSLEPYHSYRIPKGMPVILPIHAIHKDEKHFDKPHDFVPERFDTEKLNDELHLFTQDKIGLHPDADAADKLALFELKVFLCSILRSFRIEPTENTPEKINYHPTSILLLPRHRLEAKLVKLESEDDPDAD